jgi:2'-5' RNA ligase
MQRLFVALAIPDDIAQSLERLQTGVPGARWQTREQLHLTLRFIGEIDGRLANAVNDALFTIDAPCFEVALHSVG